MREAASARGGGPRLTGVVDTLSAGYGVVNRRPWIVLIPVLLDLLLWFGPQLSVAPLVGQLLSRPDVQRGFGPNDAQAFEATRQMILTAADDLNVLQMLSTTWGGVPSIMPAVGGGRGPFTFVTSWVTALGVILGLLLAGALLGCLYRSIIAQEVRDDGVTVRGLPGQVLRAWLRLTGLALVLVAAGLLLGLPMAMLMVGAALVGRELVTFGVTLMMAVVLWTGLYLFFAPDGIFVGRLGPLQAIRRSVAIVRSNFWAALRLVVLIEVILLGMGQVWLAIATRAPWGPALGIVGNAYIASGLVAASMLFYRERAGALPSGRPAAAA